MPAAQIKSETPPQSSVLPPSIETKQFTMPTTARPLTVGEAPVPSVEAQEESGRGDGGVVVVAIAAPPRGRGSGTIQAEAAEASVAATVEAAAEAGEAGRGCGRRSEWRSSRSSGSSGSSGGGASSKWKKKKEEVRRGRGPRHECPSDRDPNHALQEEGEHPRASESAAGLPVEVPSPVAEQQQQQCGGGKEDSGGSGGGDGESITAATVDSALSFFCQYMYDDPALSVQGAGQLQGEEEEEEGEVPVTCHENWLPENGDFECCPLQPVAATSPTCIVITKPYLNVRRSSIGNSGSVFIVFIFTHCSLLSPPVISSSLALFPPSHRCFSFVCLLGRHLLGHALCILRVAGMLHCSFICGWRPGLEAKHH